MLELVKQTNDFPIETREQAIAALYEIKGLHDRLQYLERASERTRLAIEKAWQRVPAMKVRRERPCRVCGELTTSLIDGRPQCENKHVRQTAIDILLGNL